MSRAPAAIAPIVCSDPSEQAQAGDAKSDVAAVGGRGSRRLLPTVRDAVWRKELKHRVNEPGFRAPPRTISAIGG